MKASKENRAMKKLSPQVGVSAKDKAMYETATYHAARKHRSPSRAKGTRPPSAR